MSVYTASRIGDLPWILDTIRVSADPMAMIARFKQSGDPAVVTLMTDLEGDASGISQAGELTGHAEQTRQSDALQVIADLDPASFQVMTDSEGMTVTIDGVGGALAP